MGRLQDNQYTSFASRKALNKVNQRQNNKNELQAKFCPPLDSALVEAIWNDSQDYETCSAILDELAQEARVEVHEAADSPTVEQASLPPPSPHSSSTNTSTSAESRGSLSDDLEFLIACFPSLSLDTLSSTLQTQQHDLEKATDILLNDIFLESDSHISDTSLENEPGDILNNPKMKRKKKKQPMKIWSSGQLPNGNRPHQHEDDDALNDRLSTVPFNCWHQYDAHVAGIAQFFPGVPQPKILGSLQRCRGNIIAAVRDLMKEHGLRVRRACNLQCLVELEKLEKTLALVLTDRSQSEIEQVATGVLVDAMMQQQQPNSKLVMTTAPVSHEKMVDAAVDFALNYDKEQRALEKRLRQQENARKAAAAAAAASNMPILPEYLRIDNGQTYVDDDPEECRNEAMGLIVERNRLFMKAAASYRQTKNRGPGESGVAFYYSDEARKLDAKAREWNMRAARALVRHQRIAKSDDHLLDLHGLTIEEAHVLVKESVTQWWSRSQTQIGRRGIKPLQIITGAGKHSAHGEAKLMPSALKLLKREGWRVEIPHSGCILVKGVETK